MIVAASFMAALPASADEARRERLAAILEAAAPPGVLDVKFNGCLMTQTTTARFGCLESVSWQDITEVTDLRIIASSPPDVGVERDGKSQLIYNVVVPLSAVLRGQASIYSQIMDEGYRRFPEDVDARLRWYAKRHRQDADPDLFSFASDTTRYCNGVTLTGPLHDYGFYVCVPTESRDEFIALFNEELGAQCETASVPQG